MLGAAAFRSTFVRTHDAERSILMPYFHMNETSIKTLPFRNFSLAFCQYLRKEIHYDPIPINLSSIKAASSDEWEWGEVMWAGSSTGGESKHIVLFSKRNPIFLARGTASPLPQFWFRLDLSTQSAVCARRHHRFNDHHQDENWIKWNKQFRFNVTVVY